MVVTKHTKWYGMDNPKCSICGDLQDAHTETRIKACTEQGKKEKLFSKDHECCIVCGTPKPWHKDFEGRSSYNDCLKYVHPGFAMSWTMAEGIAYPGLEKDICRCNKPEPFLTEDKTEICNECGCYTKDTLGCGCGNGITVKCDLDTCKCEKCHKVNELVEMH